MADLFDLSSSPSPPPPPPPQTAVNFTLESDDISSLLHTLLQNSSQSSISCAPAHLIPHPQQPLVNEDRRLFAGSAGFSQQAGLLDSPSALNFRFAGGFYGSDANERAGNAFSSSIALSMEGIGEAECESEEQEEAPVNLPPARSSSKRSRAAEVHNLSEKRRRQRINEKMKALQKLIPNSNKTDKASMLDEAIEYLKQLQLQVQMLTLRNGVDLHQFYLPGISQPVQPPQVASLLYEANSSRVGSFTGRQDAPVQAVFDLSGKPVSDYKILMPRMSENSNLGLPFVAQPSTNAHYRPLNASVPSKALCKDPPLPQLQVDMSQGQSSSSGVSS